MRVIVFMADKDALTRPSHTMLLIMFLQSLQPGHDRGVFFWLLLFGAECVIAERVESDRLWLVGIE